VGLKNIEIMEREDLLAHASKVGTYFEDRMKGLESLPLVGNVRGKKLMLCVENVASKISKEPLPDQANESKRISNLCESMGLIVRPIGHLNVMSPPLVITESQIDFVAETLEKAILLITDELVREGYKVG
jgi:adenosylmethionine-8-amino-7-oxononanoate aminotransferase